MPTPTATCSVTSHAVTSSLVARVLGAIEADCERAAAAYAEGVMEPRTTSYPTVVVAPAELQLREPITLFHSATVPPLSLVALATAVVRATRGVDDTTALLAALLMLRHQRVAGIPTTTHMMHRLFVAAVLVAAKANQDAFPNNALLAATSGVPLRELARLERAILRDLRWRAVVFERDVRDGLEALGVADAALDASSHSASASRADAWPAPAEPPQTLPAAVCEAGYSRSFASICSDSGLPEDLAVAGLRRHDAPADDDDDAGQRSTQAAPARRGGDGDSRRPSHAGLSTSSMHRPDDNARSITSVDGACVAAQLPSAGARPTAS